MAQTNTVELTITNTDTITRSSGDFTSDGFTTTNTITIWNSSNNTNKYTIKSLTATTITTNETLTNESAFNGVILTAGNVLWTNETIQNNISSNNTTGIQHYVFLNLGARDRKGITGLNFETNRVGLKVESLTVSTGKTVPAFPMPGVAAITGEAQTLALDLGMAQKTINMNGIITDQFIVKKFNDSTDSVNNPSVFMTAHEIAQLMHSHVDSAGLQQYQTMNELIMLIPSRVDGRYSYHDALPEASQTNPTEFTSIENLPLIPFSYKVRAQDNQGSIYQYFPDVDGKKFTNFPDAVHAGTEITGVKGFIRNFGTTFEAGSPFVTFTLDFEVAFIIG